MDDNQLRLSRRTFLASCVGTITISLAGCTQDRTDLNPIVGCEGDTRPGLEFDTELLSVAYDEQSETWNVTCNVVVRFDYVSKSQNNVGFVDAALAAYAANGTRIARNPIGDVTWADVPGSNRKSFDAQCGGRYEMGKLSRQKQLELLQFPHWIGLDWKDRTGPNPVEDGDEVVRYTGDAESDVTPQVAEYEQVTVGWDKWPPSNRNE